MPIVENPTRVPETGMISKVRKFLTLKRQIDDLSKEHSLIKTELSELVDTQGEVDDKGHKWIQLPEEIEGYKALQRQRKVSRRINEEAARKLLVEKKLSSRCYKSVPVLDEDEIMSCLYEGLLTEEEIDQIFPSTISWAFVPSKA